MTELQVVAVVVMFGHAVPVVLPNVLHMPPAAPATPTHCWRCVAVVVHSLHAML
jgi:hypothetical protein